MKILSFCLIVVFFSTNLPVYSQVRQDERGVGIKPITHLPAKEKRWALIIGVDNYGDENISDLRGADNDAATLADSLKRYAGFPDDQVILLTTAAPNARQPTRANILRRLSNLRGLVKPDDLLLISFSGHGIERDGKAFLIPSDATATDDVDLLEDTAISVEGMKRQVKNTKVQQVLFLLDACRNDPTSGRSDSINPLTTAYTRGLAFDVKNKEVEAFATIYATSVGARAYEYTEKRQGYFSWAVIEALSGKAANADGEVTLGSLVKYVSGRVPKLVQIDLGISKVQKPFAQIEGYKADELVLAIAEIRVQPVSPRPIPLLTANDVKSGDDIFWEEISRRNSITAYQNYLSEYQTGKYAAIARLRIKDLQEAEKQAGNTRKAEEAERLKNAERQKWQEAAQLNTTDGYKSFLANYPNGEYKATADLRIKDLEAKAETENLRNLQKVITLKRSIGSGVEMEFVGIPAGSFMMGSPKGEVGIFKDETQHLVTISKGFWMGKYEVTIGEWKAVMGDLPEGMKTGLDAKFFEDERHPVVEVSWDDAQEFIKKLNAKYDGVYRLPSEAEWEYAARARTRFAFGDSLSAEQANFDGRAKGKYLEKTTVVGSHQSNKWGLYDMQGNVLEWCQDWYGAYPSRSVTDPKGPTTGLFRVFRGGNYLHSAADRRFSTPSTRDHDLGFRLIME